MKKQGKITPLTVTPPLNSFQRFHRQRWFILFPKYVIFLISFIEIPEQNKIIRHIPAVRTPTLYTMKQVLKSQVSTGNQTQGLWRTVPAGPALYPLSYWDPIYWLTFTPVNPVTLICCFGLALDSKSLPLGT